MLEYLKEKMDAIVISITCILIGTLASLISFKLSEINPAVEEQLAPIFRNYEGEIKSQPIPKPKKDDNDKYSLNDIKIYLEPWVNQKIKNLESRVDTLDHRTWLLAVVNNENSMISKKVAGEELSGKYIIFDKAWKLSKTPEFIKITPEDYKKLMKSVNNTPTVPPKTPKTSPSLPKSNVKPYCRPCNVQISS
jgi:hypothetical protein